MQIVIDIESALYEWVHRQLDVDEGWSMVQDAIMNGTPLPKGHGRLVDADEIIKIITDVDGYERFENSNLFAKHYYDVVDEAPTIIKAYREVEE